MLSSYFLEIIHSYRILFNFISRITLFNLFIIHQLEHELQLEDQEIRQASVDMSFMQNVLRNVHSPVQDDPTMPDMNKVAPISGPSSVIFE